MKKILSVCLIICILISLFYLPINANTTEIESHKILEYNINGALSVSNYDKVFSVVEEYKPDLIAFNEVHIVHTKRKLSEALESAGYSRFGTSDCPETTKGAWANYIFINKDKYYVADSGAFSLSDTPEDPHAFISYMDEYSRSKIEGRPRNCNWVYLVSKASHDRFIFASTHLQWAVSEDYDYNAIGLAVLGEQLSILKQKYSCEVICCGDMNAEPDSDAMIDLVSKGFSIVNDSTVTSDWGGRIDNILYTSEFSFCDFSVGEHTYSDHRPITAVLSKHVPKRYSLSADLLNVGGSVVFDIGDVPSVFALSGETVRFDVVPDIGFIVDEIKIDEDLISVENSGHKATYSYVISEKDSCVSVKFKVDPNYVPTPTNTQTPVQSILPTSPNIPTAYPSLLPTVIPTKEPESTQTVVVTETPTSSLDTVQTKEPENTLQTSYLPTETVSYATPTNETASVTPTDDIRVSFEANTTSTATTATSFAISENNDTKNTPTKNKANNDLTIVIVCGIIFSAILVTTIFAYVKFVKNKGD